MYRIHKDGKVECDTLEELNDAMSAGIHQVSNGEDVTGDFSAPTFQETATQRRSNGKAGQVMSARWKKVAKSIRKTPLANGENKRDRFSQLFPRKQQPALA